MGRDKYSLFGPRKVQLEDEDVKFEINAASAGNLGSFLEGTYRMIHGRKNKSGGRSSTPQHFPRLISTSN